MKNIIRSIQKKNTERKFKKLSRKLKKTVEKAVIEHNKVMKATE